MVALFCCWELDLQVPTDLYSFKKTFRHLVAAFGSNLGVRNAIIDLPARSRAQDLVHITVRELRHL